MCQVDIKLSRKIGIEENEGFKVNCIDKIFKRIIEELFQITEKQTCRGVCYSSRAEKYPDLLGSQAILKATIEQLWRCRVTIGQLWRGKAAIGQIRRGRVTIGQLWRLEPQ